MVKGHAIETHPKKHEKQIKLKDRQAPRGKRGVVNDEP
jgi:hypothetical protein